jgi:hypothetical protein
MEKYFGDSYGELLRIYEEPMYPCKRRGTVTVSRECTKCGQCDRTVRRDPIYALTKTLRPPVGTPNSRK